ncbi:MAG: carbamoyl phosphate synthase small subunit [Evtepia sp.]
MQSAYLILENGTVFTGRHFGATAAAVGELVVTTVMGGFTESLTDPNYANQIIMFSFPMIGNYGVSREDMESATCPARGVVVRECSDTPSNFRAELSMNDFLKQENVIGISGVDTRALTQLLRDCGPMRAVITTEEPKGQTIPNHAWIDTNRLEKPKIRLPAQTILHHVAILDYGANNSLIAALLSRGCKVTQLPYRTGAAEIISLAPDGVLVSGGAGDPADYDTTEIIKLLGRLPMLGIGLGHQLMARAVGANTVRMKLGHRGANQPVRDLKTKKILVTQQNHGFVVDRDSLCNTEAVLRYENVNDQSCEGLDYPNLSAFSLQFAPETHQVSDERKTLDRFLAMLEGK